MRAQMNPRPTFVAVAVALATALTLSCVDQGGESAVAIDPDDIGGVVTSAQGPEAGVWVIAETTDLPTRFIRTTRRLHGAPPGGREWVWGGLAEDRSLKSTAG